MKNRIERMMGRMVPAWWSRVCLGAVIAVLPLRAADVDPVDIVRGGSAEGVDAPKRTIVTVEDVMKVVLEEDDLLEITVVGDPVLSLPTAKIDKGGVIIHPVLGEIKVAGMTLKEATEMIREVLEADYLVKPNVSLRIVEYGTYKFSVTGEVLQPGTFSMPRNVELDISQAVAQARPTRLGSSKVQVERMVDGQRTFIKVNLGDRKADRVLVQPGDQITVDEKLF